MEWNWVICRDVDGHRERHTEWSQSEKGKQVPYVNTYMWNLEGWYRWSYLQSRNREQTHGHQGGKERGEWGDWKWDTHSTKHKIGD